MHHVVVGNSIAGMEAALALRAAAPDARITVVSAESPHPVARTAWMYVLCGQLALRDTEFQPREVWARHRLLSVHARVARVRTDARRLDLADGTTLAYDRLLLAVGSIGRRPAWMPTHGPGLHRFVTLTDLEKLDREARPGQAVAVVGGGLIGVEVAEVLHQRGLRVHFLVRETSYFPVALDAAESAAVAEHIRGHGVDVRFGTEVLALARRSAGYRLALRDAAGHEAPLDVDHVVAAIGVEPNTAFLAGDVPLAADGAIEVDAGLRTGVPEVWAAGDCANVDWPDGGRRPEQLWYTARDQGRVAGRAMADKPATYRRTCWVNAAKFFDLEYTTAGFLPPPPAPVEASGGGVAGVLPRPPNPSGGGYRTWFQRVPGTAITQRIVCRGARVVGFNCIGSRWNTDVFLRWIHERRGLDHVLAHMQDAAFDAELAPPFRVLPTATVTEG